MILKRETVWVSRRGMFSALVVFLVARHALGDDSLKDTLNVRTVLFKDMDAAKTCWSADDILLLQTRKMMQDIIPTKIPTNFESLAAYIKHSIDTVKTKSTPDTARITILAVYDVIGGYMKTVVLPILNEAYYAGNVQYSVAAELHGLYGKILTYLGTDGSSWSQPCSMEKIPTKVQALSITICNTTEACNALKLNCNAQLTGADNYMTKEPSKIGMPALDDHLYPNAIIMPLSGSPLFSLMTNSSANLLPKFYILATRCLASPTFTKKDIINFNHEFYEWIKSSVIPHIYEDDRWYPGFGGVMRIVETMKERGLSTIDYVRPHTEPSEGEIPGDFSELNQEECSGSVLMKKRWLIIAIIAVVTFLVLCCCCICIMRGSSKVSKDDCELRTDGVPGDEGIAKTLVSIYCGVKESIIGGKSQSSSKDVCKPKKEPSSVENKSRSSQSSRKSKRYRKDRDRYYSESEVSSGVPSSNTDR